MAHLRRNLVPFVLLAAVAGMPLAAQAAPNAGEKVLDALVLRPAGLLKIAVGGAALLTYPLVHWSGQGPDMIDRCWSDPVESVFERPLGEI